MDYKAYIESGKLESYVQGNCTPEEAREAECMARIFPEVKEELESIRSAIEKYALANKVEPPEKLKSRILAAIHGEQLSSNDPGRAKVIEMSPPAKRTGNPSKYLVAACMAIAMISAFIVFSLSKSNKRLSREVADLKGQEQKIREEYASVQEQLMVMSDPHALPVAMKGLPLSPQSLATVYWNRDSKHVYLSVNSLPEPPEGKQYQLWGIVNGNPVDLGVFNIPSANGSLLQEMKPVEDAVAFAVTLENSGGSAVPTMAQMYVIGNI